MHNYYLTRYKPYSFVDTIVACLTGSISLLAVNVIAFNELSESEKRTLSVNKDCKLLFLVKDAADIDVASSMLDALLEQAEQKGQTDEQL